MSNKHSFKTLILALILTATGLNMQAQDAEYSVMANGMLPTGVFGQKVDPVPAATFAAQPVTVFDRDNICTGASAGLGVTARAGIRFDIGIGELMPFGEASFYWNPSKKNIRESFENSYFNETRGKSPAYINIPIILGLQYRYPVNSIIMPFFEIGLGYDLLFIGNNGYKDESRAQWYTYSPSGALAWSIAGGTYLTDRVYVSLYYNGLGGHMIDYTKKSAGRFEGGTPDHTVKRNLGEFGLRIGFTF